VRVDRRDFRRAVPIQALFVSRWVTGSQARAERVLIISVTSKRSTQ
jgi:hypothetical protein